MGDTPYSTHRDGKYVQVPPIDELCLMLKEKFLAQEETNLRLAKDNADLKSGIFEKEEMARMKAAYDNMREDYCRGFSISKSEEDLINKWKMRHDEKRHHASTMHQRIKLEGVSGGRHTYEFIPTALGVIGKIKCSCGESFTFRDLF